MRQKLSLAEVWSRYVGEPFLLRPWEIAELTDWQVEQLYVRSNEAAAAEMDRAKNGGGTNSSRGPGGISPSPPEDLEEFVHWWSVVNGGGRDEAIKRHKEIFSDG